MFTRHTYGTAWIPGASPIFTGNISNDLGKRRKNWSMLGCKFSSCGLRSLSLLSATRIFAWTAYFALFQMVLYLSSTSCFADSRDSKVWFINSGGNNSNYPHKLNSNFSLSGLGSNGSWYSSWIETWKHLERLSRWFDSKRLDDLFFPDWTSLPLRQFKLLLWNMKMEHLSCFWL